MSSSNPSLLDDGKSGNDFWLSDDWPNEVIACRYEQSRNLDREGHLIREVNIRIQFLAGTTSERCLELITPLLPTQFTKRKLCDRHTDAGFALVPAFSIRIVDALD